MPTPFGCIPQIWVSRILYLPMISLHCELVKILVVAPLRVDERNGFCATVRPNPLMIPVTFDGVLVGNRIAFCFSFWETLAFS